eukprot:PLAT1129.2.p1 GENE.PLAT1129.2~~PLAT1129.2.p1  ORF type:complete len:759 (+),score=332.40 PLAT1129.2:19-2295(+)
MSRVVTTLTCLGFTMLVIGIGGYFAVSAGLSKGLRKEFVISPQSPRFTAFTEGVPVHKQWYMWNLTNYLNVSQHGAKPQYEQLGPYVYTHRKARLNPEFSHDGEEVTFVEHKYDIFDAELTADGLSEDDIIYNLSPTYVGLVHRAGSESQVQLGLVGPLLLEAFQWLQSALPHLAGSHSAAALLAAEESKLTALAGSRAAFLATWANATTPPSAEWDGMILGGSGLPVAVAEAMWSANTSLGLLNGTWAATGTWAQAGEDEDALARVQAEFPSLSASQLLDLLTWHASYVSNTALPALMASLKQYGVTHVHQLPYYQWSSANLTDGLSLHHFFPKYVKFEYEYGTAARDLAPAARIGTAQAESLLNGSSPLFNTFDVADFFLDVQQTAQNASYYKVIEQKFGIVEAQTNELKFYLIGIVGLSEQTLRGLIFNNASGLFPGLTVREWLYEHTDALVELVDAQLDHLGPISTNMTREQALATVPPTTLYTGKGDVGRINSYKLWQGQKTIDTWDAKEVVAGTDGSAWGLNVGISSTLPIFVASTRRDTKLVNPTGEVVHFEGIKLGRHRLDDDVWKVNSEFDMRFDGVWNLTTIHRGSPICVTRPHLYGVDPLLQGLIDGMNPDPKLHTTTVDVEPVSGTTMQASKVAQVNLFLRNNTGYFDGGFGGCVWPICTPNVPTGRLYPLAWYSMDAGVSAADAKKFRDSVYMAQKLKLGLLISGGTVGCLLLIAAVYYQNVKRNDARDVEGSVQHDPLLAGDKA